MDTLNLGNLVKSGIGLIGTMKIESTGHLISASPPLSPWSRLGRAPVKTLNKGEQGALGSREIWKLSAKI